jgi:hypothetical protein
MPCLVEAGFAGTIAPHSPSIMPCPLPRYRNAARSMDYGELSHVLSFDQDGHQSTSRGRTAIRNGPCMIGAHAAQNLAGSMVDF